MKNRIPQKAVEGIGATLANTISAVTDASADLVEDFKNVLKSSLTFAKAEGCAVLKEIVSLGRLHSFFDVVQFVGGIVVAFKAGRYSIIRLSDVGNLDVLSVFGGIFAIAGVVAFLSVDLREAATAVFAPRVYLIKYFNGLRLDKPNND